jgi:hypothetical protein
VPVAATGDVLRRPGAALVVMGRRRHGRNEETPEIHREGFYFFGLAQAPRVQIRCAMVYSRGCFC